MKTSSILVIVIAVLVILGGWYAYATYYSPSSASPSTATTVNVNGNGNDYYPNGAPGSATTSSATSSGAGLSADVNAGVSVSSAPMSATVTLTSSGPTPKSVTIKKGGTVTWSNTGSGNMWIASAPHPTHTGYDGTNEQTHCAASYTGPAPFDECKNSNSYSFTFNKVGSWSYHNHQNTSQFGTIVVVE